MAYYADEMKKGPKPKKASERKTRYLIVRVREDQRRLFEQAAASKGMSLSAWATSVLDRAAKRATRSEGDQ